MQNLENKAPQFCLPNQDEVEICLRDFRGKWIVLYFYPKDDTPGCTTQACDFTQALPDFSALNATVVGISPDSAKKHRNFIQKHELKILLLSDEEKEVSKLYDVWKLKKNYGKEYMGIVRSTFLIDPEGNIAQKWENVRVKNHITKVKEALEKFNK